MKKKNKSGVLIKIFTALSVVVAIIFCGYMSLDKFFIPKKFGVYGITNMKDLTTVFASLYSVPKEKKIIVNGYGDGDLESGIEKLQIANYKIEDDGTVLNENLANFKGDGSVLLSDRELAAVCDKILKSGLLEENLPNLNYIGNINIKIIDLLITVDPASYNEVSQTYSKANVKLIIKINTEELREQISKQMETTQALLKIIIPSSLYFSVDYDVDLSNEDDMRTTGTISINGKKVENSKLLINLLIQFIFPSEDEMTYEKFTEEIGNILIEGIRELGNFSFVASVDETELSGIYVK